MTATLLAAEMQWPAAFAMAVFFVCVAAVVIYFLHVLAKPDSRIELTDAPVWKVERKTKEWEEGKEATDG